MRRRGPPPAEVLAGVLRLEARIEDKLMSDEKRIDVEHAREELEQGKSLTQVARENGCSRSTLRRHLGRDGAGEVAKFLDDWWGALPLVEKLKVALRR
jgi:hypothetical protein